jgi:hypothetical protein
VSPDSDPRSLKQPRLSERAWTWLIIGVVLAIATMSLLWLGPSRPPQTPAAADGSALTPAMVPLVTGEEPVPELFRRAGCPVCHAIPGLSGAEGQVGPKLVLGTTGPQRLSDPAYRGQAKTVREYVVESILSPGIYVVPGYPALAMPRWYGQKLSATALEKIAAYLEEQREEGDVNR